MLDRNVSTELCKSLHGTFTWLRHVKNKRAERWIARPVLLG